MPGKFVTLLNSLVKYSLQYACITHCLFEYVGDFVVCSGPSMEPTLYSKNILLTERISARLHKPNRGDIIIAISPTNPDQYICKRIIGLPGDKIITEESPLKSNEKLLIEEKTVKKQITEDYIPRGHVWIEGDNEKNSADSRYYGPLPIGLIKSRAICRIWPLSEMKIL